MPPMNNIVPLHIFAIYFSPYTAHAIEIDGVVYPSVEHAYQCQRYTDEAIREEIRSARSPVLAWQLSSKYKHLQKLEFKDPDHKLSVMEMLMRMKVAQHADVCTALLDTGDARIVKHITTYPPGDGFWDDGEDGKGLDHMGRLWMKIRDDEQKKQ